MFQVAGKPVLGVTGVVGSLKRMMGGRPLPPAPPCKHSCTWCWLVVGSLSLCARLTLSRSWDVASVVVSRDARLPPLSVSPLNFTELPDHQVSHQRRIIIIYTVTNWTHCKVSHVRTNYYWCYFQNDEKFVIKTKILLKIFFCQIITKFLHNDGKHLVKV